MILNRWNVGISDYSNIPSSANESPVCPPFSLCYFLIVARAPTWSASNLCNNGKLSPPNNYHFYYFYHHYQAFRRYTTIYSRSIAAEHEELLGKNGRSSICTTGLREEYNLASTLEVRKLAKNLCCLSRIKSHDRFGVFFFCQRKIDSRYVEKNLLNCTSCT